jgi:hypothetical protein
MVAVLRSPLPVGMAGLFPPKTESLPAVLAIESSLWNAFSAQFAFGSIQRELKPTGCSIKIRYKAPIRLRRAEE